MYGPEPIVSLAKHPEISTLLFRNVIFPGTEELALMVFAVPMEGLELANEVVKEGVILETCRTKFALVELLAPSIALMMKVYEPSEAGAVPEITPVAVSKFSVLGNGVPALIE